MKKISVVLVLAGIGYLAWTLLGAESDAARCYKEFADAWAHQRLDDALALTAVGSPARRLVEERIERKRRALPAGMTYGIAGLAFNVISEREAEDGRTVTLRAEQTTRVTGAGQESAFGRPVLADHEVTLTAEGSRWKVISFEEKVR
jgi:hypothetical protein